jgi:hypothetical protein
VGEGSFEAAARRARIDSHANLVAMGVIPSPRPQPDPFPGSQLGFVPDPPR